MLLVSIFFAVAYYCVWYRTWQQHYIIRSERIPPIRSPIRKRGFFNGHKHQLTFILSAERDKNIPLKGMEKGVYLFSESENRSVHQFLSFVSRLFHLYSENAISEPFVKKKTKKQTNKTKQKDTAFLFVFGSTLGSLNLKNGGGGGGGGERCSHLPQ